MDSVTPEDFPPQQATAVKVGWRSVTEECGGKFRVESGGYAKDSKWIAKIVDKDGKAHKGVWEKEWSRIAPGIETRRPDKIENYKPQENVKDEAIRIHHSACPVWVLSGSRSELVYSDEPGE